MIAGRISRCIAVGVVGGLLVMAQAWGAQVPSAGSGQSDGKMQADAERIVSKYKAVFAEPPTRVPSRDSVGGPLLGNGDLGAVISGTPEAQRFWISKNNFWRLKTEAGATVVLGPEGAGCPAEVW